MVFADERPALEAEFEAWYAAYPWPGAVALERQLHEESAAHPEWTPLARKAWGYRRLASACPVKVFRHSPFYFELATGAERRDLGTGGVGSWLKREPDNAQLCRASIAWWAVPGALGLCVGWPMYDDNHHTLGYERVLTQGLRGLIATCRTRLASPVSPAAADFLQAAMAGNEALLQIAARLAAQAQELAAAETDADVRQRLQRLAATAARVPAEPAATFYEALAAVAFMFRVLQFLEGNGLSALGHLDRLLMPYLAADLAAGRLNLAQARDLIAHFLALVDTRFGMRQAGPHHVGSNTALTLGGCDRAGIPVANPLTELFLDVHRELRLVDPKMNLRLSPDHPPGVFAAAARFLAHGGNSLAVFNDPVVIAANVRAGKALPDSRLYVSGGCQENVLENCELNSRATMYLNLGNVFLMGFFPDRFAAFCDREAIIPQPYRTPRFDDLYAAFLANLDAVLAAHIRERNRTEQEAWRYNPCPAHSSTMDDCLERGQDMFAGGIRYAVGSISLVGAGSLVDALFALRQAVCRDRLCTLDQLRAALANDFREAEPLRLRLANRVAKFGQEDPEVQVFAARVFADLARVSTGRPNGRGGQYEASLFSFRAFAGFAPQTGALPDGRRAGEPLSPGMGPSLLALGRQASVGSVLNALGPLDLTQYPVVAVLDLKVPQVPVALAPAVLGPVIGRFLAQGGSVLQINCVDQQTLIEARQTPALHPDLVVRISGYSAYFTGLAPDIQDELIARTVAV